MATAIVHRYQQVVALCAVSNVANSRSACHAPPQAIVTAANPHGNVTHIAQFVVFNFQMNPVLIEKEWKNADGLVAEAKRRGVSYQVLPRAELRAMTGDEFLSAPVVFASTGVIQVHVAPGAVPDTYPPHFASLYRRTIQRKRAGDISAFPVFIKPIDDKSRAGRVVTKPSELPTKGEEVYVADVVDFDDEWRLLVGRRKVWAAVHQRGAGDSPPPESFTKQVCAKTGTMFLCVDVGYIRGKGWAVVDVSPPFALDDYDMDVAAYWDYCEAAWKGAPYVF